MTNQELLNQIRCAEQLYCSLLAEVCCQHQLSRCEADVLIFLYHHPQLDTASQIVAYRMLPKSNVSHAVDALVKRGYLLSRRDDADRRRIHLAVTDAALCAVQAINAAQQIWQQMLLDGFTEQEKALYRTFKLRIAQNSINALKERINYAAKE